MVTGLAGGQRADLPALLASIPSISGSNGETACPADSDTSISTVQFALAAESLTSTERSEGLDYLKAAVGLAIGMGLTSGPLFPDLLASVQARLPKWMRKRIRAREKVAGRSEDRPPVPPE